MAPPFVFGLQLSVCNLEFSIYYGHQLCCAAPLTPCLDIPDLVEQPAWWLVHSLPVPNPNSNLLVKSLSALSDVIWTGQESFLLDKVRATSFILLLGVGSFVCYRIFHHLKHRLGKRKSSTICRKLHKKRSLSNTKSQLCKEYIETCSLSNASSLSDISVTSSDSSSFGDRETSSDGYSLTDCNELGFKMGVSASNHLGLESVRYNKTSGIHFLNSGNNFQPSNNLVCSSESVTPRRERRIHRLSSLPSNNFVHNSYKENDFDCSGSFGEPFYLDESVGFTPNDAISMKGNFSPDSLKERVLKAEELWSLSRQDGSNPRNSSLRLSGCQLKHEYSIESFSALSESRGDWSVARTLSIDSQISELAPELQQDAEEIGCVAVESFETLETELIDLKQTVLDLDAELVNLKVYRKPPEKCWELTNISLSEDSRTPLSESSVISEGRVADVVKQYKAKMWYKGLLNSRKNGSFKDPPNEKEDESEVRWDLVGKGLLDWDVEGENTFDSGSDFGNSLETDSIENEVSSSTTAPAISLEWDSDVPSEVDGRWAGSAKIVPSNTSSETGSSSGAVRTKANRSHKRKALLQRRGSIESHSIRSKINRSYSSVTPSDFLACQIQRAIGAKVSIEDSSPSIIDASFVSASDNEQLQCITEMESMKEISRLEDEESGFQEKKEWNNENQKEAKNSSRPNSLEINSNGNKDNNGWETTKPHNWDSAYCEDSDFLETCTQLCIGELVNIPETFSYTKCQNILVKPEEYQIALKDLGVTGARKLKSDHYCTIRAAIFQVLVQGHSIFQAYGGPASVYQSLTSWSQTVYPWLLEWRFSHKLSYKIQDCHKGFWDCLHALQEMEERISSSTDPESLLMNIFNEDSDLQAKLCEAVRLLMVTSGLKLFEELASLHGAGESPLQMFALLLFGRESCQDPKELVLGHLSQIGETIPLDQVDLYLLGISLTITLKMVQAHLLGKEEFVVSYPDWNLPSEPQVFLAIDDNLTWVLQR